MGNASNFLIDTLLSLYLVVIIMRIVLRWVGADFYNPFSQVIVKLTDPVLTPLRRLIPAGHRLDTAAAVLLIALTLLKFYLLATTGGHFPNLAGGLVIASAEILEMVTDLFFFTLLARIVMSWIQPHSRHPIVTIIYAITEPLMAPLRRVIPPIGGLDFSPIALFLLLGLFSRIIINPLLSLGYQLAF